jgi:muramoyltetrapeptide carboxypeptidase
MAVVKPKHISPGDRIAFVAPAGSPDTVSLIKGADYFHKLGYKIKIYPQVRRKNRYLAGDDDARAQALMDAFADRNIDAVFCARGGYGALRILEKLDFNKIKKNPKPLLGYSDITVLLLSIYKKTGLVAFHGPMPDIDFGARPRRYTRDYLFKALFTKDKIGNVMIPKDYKIIKISPGSASGVIVGGNLSLMAKLVGSDYLPSFRNKIVFFEDIGENAERVDGYLAQLFMSTDFGKANGFIIGEFSDDKYRDKKRKNWTVLQVIKDYFGKIGKPVIFGFPCGHGVEKITIPIGTRVLLDADEKLVVFKEAGVR